MQAKQKAADYYSDALSQHVKTPVIGKDAVSVWAQYTVQTELRDKVADTLRKQDIPTAIYYPKPLHLQSAYMKFPRAAKSLPVSESLAKNVLSLPMHPYLNAVCQDRIVDAVIQATKDLHINF